MNGKDLLDHVISITLIIFQQDLKERAINSAKRMLAGRILTLEKIAEYAGLPFDEVEKLKAERTA